MTHAGVGTGLQHTGYYEDCIMPDLSYSSERAFLDYSKALARELGNIKLTTLRKAMAKVDNVNNLEKYRSLLREDTTLHDVPSNVYIEFDDNQFLLSAEAYLPYGFGLEMTQSAIEHLNDLISQILIGENGFGLQELDAERISTKDTLHGQDLYRVSGYFNIGDITPDEALSCLRHYFAQEGKQAVLRTKEGDEPITLVALALRHPELAEAWYDDTPALQDAVAKLDVQDATPWCEVSIGYLVKEMYGVTLKPNIARVLARRANR
jgi:hypothetical protein